MSKSDSPVFLAKSNIYEVNLRQYTPQGTIKAFLEHLPRLCEMGVEILWMMPIHPIGDVKRKGVRGSYYSIKDFCAVNPEFGTKQDFKLLVDEVHKKGMKIIIDWVANHAAWDNVWTISHPEFFIHDDKGYFKPPFDWDDVIQVDHSNKLQQEAMLNAMKFWITEFDIDGYRADLAHLTPLPFWINARKTLDKIKPGLVWLAETEDIPYYEAFDIVFAWKWMHATTDMCRNNLSVHSLMDLLEKQKTILPPGALELFFTTNHDENSWNGTEYEKYGIYAKALAVFNYTYPGSVPLIYSGQELPNYKRLRFFEKDLIEWNENIALHSFYKTLNDFHKNNFTGGNVEFMPTQKNMLAFSYTKDDNCVLVFLNLDKEKLALHYDKLPVSGSYQNIFTGEKHLIGNNIFIELGPGGFSVLKNNKAK